MNYLLDQYFKETAPAKYQFLDYYQHRKSQKDFTNNFRLEAQRLRKCLEHLVEYGSTPEKQTAAQRLLNSHRNRCVDVDKFWNEIECESLDIQYDKEKKQLQLDQVKVARVMTQGTEEGVETIMRNVNTELDESATPSKPYSLRKRQRVDYNEDRWQERDGHITPSPRSPDEDNPFIENDDVIIIDDVPFKFSFKNVDPANDLYVGEINMSLLFRNYQNQSFNLANTKGLFVESNVQEILSLSSILLLASDSYSDTMVNHFGLPLLNQIHEKFKPKQQILLDSNSEETFRKAVKMAMNGSRDDVINWLCGRLSNVPSLRKDLGFVVLDCLRTLPTSKIRNQHSEITHYTNFLDRIMKGFFNDPDKHVVQWPNTALDESKARKFEGRAKQPDFIVSIICQLQSCATIFVGEVSPPSKKGDVYKNCNDLIRLSIFMKDSLDSSIDKGVDIKVLGFQCIDYKIDYYIMDLVQGIYTMVHIGQTLIPASLKDMPSFVDDIELFLRAQDIFHKSFAVLYTKLCNPGDSEPLATKAIFKQDTLGTPKFKKLIFC
nr:8927_t:CDS:2 [Entrophospora candida]